MKIFAKTKGISQERWLDLRTQGIGGSDVSILAGINPYTSVYQLWMEKTGLLQPREVESEYTHYGKLLEPIVRKEFAVQTGKKVIVPQCMYQHPDYPFMLANLDGIIRNKDDGLSLFEAKTASAFKAKDWENGIPDGYLLQIQHYMAVTGANKTYIAALIGGNHFLWREVCRDEELISLIIQMEQRFWEKHVLPRIPPELDGSKATAEYLAKKYQKAEHTIVQLPECAQTYVTEYERVAEEMELLNNKKQEMANKLKELLRENEQGQIQDRIVSWKNVTKTSFDQKTFQQDDPECYKKYLKNTNYRRFSIA